ncbi:DNA mismatch repair endonuclease MutL [Thiotrichales bacterium 19S9-12]|nr:DNA mismatch repair endonuclease MutL [Thiotrichales bacterium 19S9-11]MCF6811228.1 DNA mismatch repair endonuclease MutL [Thiotrichales bacterium 19S9-12]
MMRRIRQLSPLLANQIAAGEVVERPASVVKELIENSIDAGATEITLEVEQGGKSLIRIKDNGSGILKDDLSLALMPHATSKVYELEELEAVDTMGFRGEALASIASVSKMILTSRHEDSDQAWEVIQKGKDQESYDFKPAAYPKGTQIEVNELFFNTPARRKFLKTDKTEFSHIDELFKRFALCYFHIEFILIHNGKTTRHLPIADNLESQLKRVSQLTRKAFLDRSLMVDKSDHNMRLWGWVGEPEIAKQTADLQYFYINGRMIKDKVVSHAIKKAYQDVLYSGRYPQYVLYLSIEPDQLDVNVHPTKSEVRFHQSQRVHQFIYTTIDQVLANTTPNVTSDEDKISIKVPEKEQVKSVAEQIDLYQKLSSDNFKEDSLFELAFSNASLTPEIEKEHFLVEHDVLTKKKQNDLLLKPVEETHPLGFAVAQLHGIYILAQNKKGLVLVDMHAAHERILYEKAKESWHHDQLEKRQELLIPLTISLSSEQMIAFEEYKPVLEKLGFEANCLSDLEIVIRSAPTFVKTNDLEKLILQLLTDFSLMGFSKEVEAYFNQFLATYSCHSALRAHDELSIEGMNEMLRQMESTERSNQCNHGRPTWVQLDFKDLDKFFMRGR